MNETSTVPLRVVLRGTKDNVAEMMRRLGLGPDDGPDAETEDAGHDLLARLLRPREPDA